MSPAPRNPALDNPISDNPVASWPASGLSAGIRARNLVKTYGGGRIRALDGFDFDAEPGRSVAITGPSGSGKSTLLFALAGLLRLDAGSVAFDGRAPVRASDWTALRQTHLGLVFQEPLLLPNISAAENVELPMLGVVADRRTRAARVAQLLEAVGAQDLAPRLPAGLSGGERQRIARARGLANRPRCLFADEPTGELDSRSAATVLDLLGRLQRDEGLTVLIVTHDPAVAARCDRRFVVRDGRGRYDP